MQNIPVAALITPEAALIGGFVVVVVLVIIGLIWWANRTEEIPTPPVKAAVPLEPLPPYQPMRQEPVITIQIPARTVLVMVVSLAILFMIYFRSRSDDGRESP